MSDTSILAVAGAERQPLKAFTEKAYLDYSRYVILDRALPYIGDGLKTQTPHVLQHYFAPPLLQ
jgi:topoisomerase-4 subunit A